MATELKTFSTEDNGLFSDSGVPLDERGEIVVKAQLRLEGREFDHPVLAFLQNEALSIYDALCMDAEQRIANVLERAREVDKSFLFAVPSGSALIKANGQPGRPRTSKGPPTPQERKQQAETRQWGSRGGKFYINSRGHKVYGSQPPPGDPSFREMTDKEVAQHVQKFINPTIFLGVKEDTLDAYVAAGIFSAGDRKIIDWFRRQFIDGPGGLIEQMKAHDPDWDENMQDAGSEINNMKLAQFMHQFFLDNVVDDDTTQEDAEETWADLANKYEQGINDVRVHAALKRQWIEYENNVNSVNMAVDRIAKATEKLHDEILDDPNGTDSALKVMSVMQGLNMLFIAGKGQVAKKTHEDKFGALHMKGTLQVNLDPLQNVTADFAEETKYAKARVNLMRMNLAQLMGMYTGVLMQATRKRNGDFDPEAIAQGNIDDDDKSDVQELIEKVIAKRMNEDRRAPKAEVENLLNTVRGMAADVARMVGDFNKGQIPGLEKMFTSGDFDAEKLLDKANEHGVGKVRKEIISAQQERESLLSAQKDENALSALPSAMKDGFWDLKQVVWDAMTKERAKANGTEWKRTPPPKAFPWQAQAVAWMLAAKRGILAYDMGMGKTASVIAASCALMDQKKIKRSILILPPVLMEQWPKEILTYAPGIKEEEILDLSPYSLEERKMMLKSEAAKNAKFIIMSSGTLCDPKEDAATVDDEGLNDGTGGMDNEFVDALNALDDTAVFVDEVHTGGYKTANVVKGELKSSVRYRLLDQILGNGTENPREYAIGMTGTPMPNSAMDTYNITDLFAKGKIGNRDQWGGTLSSTTFDENTGQRVPTNPDKVRELKDRLKPYVFSKLVSDDDVRPVLAQNLPPDPAQVRNDLKPSQRKGKNGYSQHDYFKRGGIIERLANEKMRQILKKREEDKKDELPEGMLQMIYKGLIVNMSRQAAISPALIDSTYGIDDPAPKIDRACADVVEHFNGGWGKKGEPVVIFGSTTRQFELMKYRLMKHHGFTADQMGEISNKTASLDRAYIQDAANDGKIKVIFVGIKSGGAGLNLQKASNHMMFLDNPWTPADKKQALGRVQRVGQQKLVRVTTYSMPDTYDSVMEDKLAEKQVMSDMLTRDEDLDALIKLTNENIQYITGHQKGSKKGPRKMTSAQLESLYETLTDAGEMDLGDMLTRKELNNIEVNQAARRKLPEFLRAEFDQAKDRKEWREKRNERKKNSRIKGMEALLGEYDKKFGSDKQKIPTETVKRIEKIERTLKNLKGEETPRYKPSKPEEPAKKRSKAKAEERTEKEKVGRASPMKDKKQPKEREKGESVKARDDHDGHMMVAKNAKKFDVQTRYKAAKDALRSARDPKQQAAAQKLVDKLKDAARSERKAKPGKEQKGSKKGAESMPKLATKHPYKNTSTKKRHGVAESELAIVHKLWRRHKGDTNSFLRDVIKPIWDTSTDGRYTNEKAQAVMKKWQRAFKKDGLLR